MNGFFKIAAIVAGGAAVATGVIIARRKCDKKTTENVEKPVDAKPVSETTEYPYQETKYDPKFLAIWEKATEVAFNPEWHNGTGYFNNCVKDLLFKQQENCVWKFTDTSGRKAIVFNNDNAICVVFQRYSDRQDILVYNSSIKLEDNIDAMLEKALQFI